MKILVSLLVVFALGGGGWYYYNSNVRTSVLSGTIGGTNDTGGSNVSASSSESSGETTLADATATAEAILSRDNCNVTTTSTAGNTINVALVGDAQEGIMVGFSAVSGEGIDFAVVQPMNISQDGLDFMSTAFDTMSVLGNFDNLEIFVDGKKLAVAYDKQAAATSGSGFSVEDSTRVVEMVAAAKTEVRVVVQDKDGEKTITLTEGERCRVGKVQQTLAKK